MKRPASIVDHKGLATAMLGTRVTLLVSGLLLILAFDARHRDLGFLLIALLLAFEIAVELGVRVVQWRRGHPAKRVARRGHRDQGSP